MPRHLTVRHITEYTYCEPVSFGRHRMMFRPRDSHSIRLLDTHLSITPTPRLISWAYDVFGNSVAFAEFGDARSDVLRFESEISVRHYETPQPTSLLQPQATTFPFTYADEELTDLRPVIVQHRPDPDGQLAAWARQFVEMGNHDTLAILTEVLGAIRSTFQYRRRPASGTQDPCRTLELKTGTCRDFALLMIEALRSLGFAARFVSGYIYSPTRVERRGAGATHAWVQVYLPGCGWIEVDPTNGIFGNRDLIRVAVARDHAQALPLTGSFVGRRSLYSGMTVTVSVTQDDELAVQNST
jgi:transglutaminase-like putative cysteine protease